MAWVSFHSVGDAAGWLAGRNGAGVRRLLVLGEQRRLPKQMHRLLWQGGRLGVVSLIALAFTQCKGAPRSEPPSDWSAVEASAVFQGTQTASARFLMWRTLEYPESRGSRVVHEAIVCGRLDAENRYFLGHVSREPETRHRNWAQYLITDAPSHVTFSTYEQPPSPADVQTFLAATYWTRAVRVTFDGAADPRICAGQE